MAEGGDFQPKVGAARVLADPFAAILAHLDEAGSHTEQVYQLEKSGEPPVMDPGGNPIVPSHPRYNPLTGTAPAPKP